MSRHSQKLPNPPCRFGRYELTTELGAGGMGKVYLARDTAMERDVALKIPLVDARSGSDVLERFRREAMAAGNLRHPHLCPVFDVGQIDGLHFMTMPFINGYALNETTERGNLPTQEEAATIIRKIATGLHRAHEQGIVHRDLKPANIMIDADGEPLVMDFGLVRLTSLDNSLTSDGALLGTLPFMSPEQTRGVSSDITAATDIYSLGIILYQLLTGELPFLAQPVVLLEKIKNEPPTPIHQLNSDVDYDLETICLKMIRKAPQDRFASMQDLADALNQWLNRNVTATAAGSTRSTADSSVEVSSLSARQSTQAVDSDAAEDEQNSAADDARPATGARSRSDAHHDSVALSDPGGDTAQDALPAEPAPANPEEHGSAEKGGTQPHGAAAGPPSRAGQPVRSRRKAAPAPAFRNRRLLGQLEVSSGRRQFVLYGQTADYFAIDLYNGVVPLERALAIQAEQNEVKCVVTINEEGGLSFGDSDQEKLFNKTVRRQSADPQAGGGQRRQFVPRNQRNADTPTEPTPATPQPAASGDADTPVDAARQVGEVTEAAASTIQTALDQVTRMLESRHRTMVIVRYPELLTGLQPSSEDLRKLNTILKWSTLTKGHRKSSSVLIVGEARLPHFRNLTRMCSTDQDNFTKEVCLGLPDQPELVCFFERLMARQSLYGHAGRLAASAQAQEFTLINLVFHVTDHLEANAETKSLDSLFDEDAQAHTLEDLLDELENMVGLAPVKQKVHELVTLAQNAPEDVGQMAHHMFFLGSPGTGKTVVARLLGRIFWALGIRSTQAFVSVSHKDIISPYNEGDTVQRMEQHIREAMGGVLFIDEVYTLADHKWGARALEVLMVAMEDHRDNLTVIMAGYAHHLPALYKVNPGLKSRVPHRLDFPDYSAEELVQIFRVMAAAEDFGLKIAAEQKLVQYVESFNRMGGIDNARGVRNLYERAKSTWFMNPSDDRAFDENMIPAPIQLQEDRARELLARLDRDYIGLPRVKAFFRDVFNRQRASQVKGGTGQTGFNHCLFLGNPGTGKTSIARETGRLFHYLGCISEPDRLVEIGADALQSQYSGEYAEKTRDRFDEAVGGVLFIDEAYRLAGDDQGRKVLDQIVQLITEPKYRNLVVVLAGYTDDMNQLLKANAGLDRRFPNRVYFDNFTPDELCRIFHRCVENENPPHHICEEERAVFDTQLNGVLRRLSIARNFGNAGAVETFYRNTVLANQGGRLMDHPDCDPLEIRIQDLTGESEPTESIDDILQELDEKFIGMQPVKNRIRDLAEEIRSERARRSRLNLPPLERQFHMRFEGNPGTGKTTIARYMARILAALGIVEHGDRVVERQGTELKGSFVGQSKDRVLELFENAAGRVVFIDEVYALYDPTTGQVDSFGREAVDTLVGCITSEANQGVVVILAGYSDRMSNFLSANQGLASRFPDVVPFPDYSPMECLQILVGKMKAEHFHFAVDPDPVPRLTEYLDRKRSQPGFGNARTVNNVWSTLKRVQRRRISVRADSQANDSCITTEDIEQLFNQA